MICLWCRRSTGNTCPWSWSPLCSSRFAGDSSRSWRVRTGEPYVRIKGTKTGNNHWDLRARIASAPEALADGTRVRLDVLNGNQVVSGGLGLLGVSVAGSVADTRLQAVAPGDIVRFQALIRTQLATLLDQLGPGEQQISLPVEFVLLDVETSP